MKRNLEGEGSKARGSKRTRSSQACTSCRRSKTRCEQPSGMPIASSSGFFPSRCHRCKVLDMHCSFVDLDASSALSAVAQPELGAMDLVQMEPSHQFISPQISFPGIFAQYSDDLMRMGRSRVNRANWNPTPVLTLQALSRPFDDTIDGEFRSRLTRVLSREQIKYLLKTFQLQYVHWLVLPWKEEARSSFLDLARCTVASRALDPATRALVAPQLIKIVEAAVAKHSFNPCISAESMMGFLTLALWSPLPCPSQGAVPDGRLLAAFAVRIGLDLRLNEASAAVIKLQARSKCADALTDAHRAELAEAIRKARLWVSLTVVESVLYTGTGRETLSHRSPADNSVIEYHPTSTIVFEEDVRIDHVVWIVDLGKRGASIQLNSVSDFDRWHREVLEVLMKFDTLHSLISEVPQHVSSLGVPLHFNANRLLVLYHALREVREVFRDTVPDNPWYTQVVHNGINIATALGKEALAAAEGVLRAINSETQLTLIRAAPDNVFVLASFAAVFLTTVYCDNFMTTDPYLGLDKLVEMTVDRLTEVAYSSDHAPAKCAQLISASLRNSRMQISKTVPSLTGDETPTIEQVVYDPLVDPILDPLNLPPQQPNVPLTTGFGNEFDEYMNSEVFLDTDFWTSFIHNLSTEATRCDTCLSSHPSQPTLVL